MSSLADRMRLVIARKWVANARAWSLKAELSDKHVQTYLDRAEKDPTSDMNREKVVALARAARVNVAWFVADEGEPRGDSKPLTVEYYVRARLREMRRDDSALGKVAADLGLDLGMVRQVWGGGPIGDVGRVKWPAAFGLSSYSELESRAAEWWRLRGERLHRLVSPADDPDVSRREANADACSLNATEQDILAVLEATDGIGPQTKEWWYERFVGHASRRLLADRDWEKVKRPKAAKAAKRVRDVQEAARAVNAKRSAKASAEPEAPPTQRRGHSRKTGTQ